MKSKWFMLWLLSSWISVFGQIPEGVTPEDRVYVDGIWSVKLCPDGADFGIPLIRLNSADYLKLSFDNLETDSRYLRYTLIHCSHDWQISELNPLEYLDGFMEDDISDYSYSFNTIQHYTHYELLFPNERSRVLKSGNYLLYVFDGDRDVPVLTRRLMIAEESPVGITGEVHAASDVNERFSKQEIDFAVHVRSFNIPNPSQTLRANILQNGRWDNAIIGLKYRSGKPGEYSFDYDNNENTMDGSAEFRFFDIKSLRYNGSRIVSVGFKDRTNQAYLLEDVARPFGAYESKATIKGHCYYKNEDYEGRNSEDYVLTHFALKCDFPVTDGDLYVFGELTDWQIHPDARLSFNEKTHYWETSLYLKQGYYNYQYVFVPTGTTTIDNVYIEGNHWETLNDYAILVYLKEEGTRYDKLIGFTYLSMKHF